MSENTAGNPNIIRIAILGFIGLGLLVVVFAAGLLIGIGVASSELFAVEVTPAVTEPPITSSDQTAEPEAPTPAAAPEATGNDPDLDLFWQVWAEVENRYYYQDKMPTEQDRIYGAIKGMVRTLDDPYTVYVDPEEAEIIRESYSGEFEGIGAYVEEAPQGGVFILRVFDGSPADQAGIKAGDVVVGINGEDVTGDILDESISKIRGEAGTDVTLLVARDGEDELLEFTVTRARIEVPTVEYRMLDDNVGYIILYNFFGNSGDQMDAAVSDLVDQGATSIVLDLRNNPGGLVSEALRIGDLFLDDGIIFIERDVDGNTQEHRSETGQIGENMPLVILINEGSASASEIIAGAVQDRERGTIIGETSFGKGSEQVLLDMDDGSQLRITFANWFTPNDHSISGIGVTPDIVVDIPETQPDPDNDTQLERAIEFLLIGQ
jgi:carboxyl-terminal processing protease